MKDILKILQDQKQGDDQDPKCYYELTKYFSELLEEDNKNNSLIKAIFVLSIMLHKSKNDHIKELLELAEKHFINDLTNAASIATLVSNGYDGEQILALLMQISLE